MALRHDRAVETWIFDLDNTLYPPSARLFDQIDRRMTGFIVRVLGMSDAEADQLRRDYWLAHGTTLAGLRHHHGIDPEAFLEHAHDIDLSGLAPVPVLAEAIAALPGRRIVHTNGSRGHAARVLAALGLENTFDASFGIDDLEFHSKPTPEAYAALISRHGHDPARSVMIEDSHGNLAEPKRLGMTTVWLTHGADAGAVPDYVDLVAEDLAGFLAAGA